MEGQGKVKLISYFNLEKETDWAVFGGTRGDVTVGGSLAYSGYKDGSTQTNFISSNISNPRLLTDAQFAGQ